MRGLSCFKKWSLGFTLAVFFAVNFFATLALPAPVHAQGDAAITAQFSAKWIWEKVGSALYSSVLASAVNGASYFMRKLAYDTARYVGSGGKGQGALAFQKSAGAYLKDVGNNALAEALDQFGKPFGLNLCKPPDIKVQAYLQVSLRRMYADEEGPQPNCTWDQLTSNWENLKDVGNLDGRDLVSQAFAVRRADQGDFGIALGLAAKVDRLQTQKQKGADSDYLAGQGFKPLVGLINGDIKTPAQVIQKETESVTVGKQTELSFSQLNGIYGSGALQIIPMAASVFLNTLTNDLLDNILQKGLFPESSGGDGASVIDAYGAAISRNRDFAEHAFAYLIASFPAQTASYDIVSEYSSCSEDGKSAGINNCVIDAQLRQALDRAKTDKPLTIGEALKQGFLDANAQLISPYREADNTNKQVCYSGKNYCYSNIQKMRKVRILPLGFEIAALKSDPDQPWKLGDVVKNFENCERDKDGVAIPSTNKPFCHLIDPNWVLKVPAAQCQAQVIGSQLETIDGPNRREECADIPTCLAKDDKGNCIGFGYCTKEKNVWQLGAQSCSAEFNTCRTLVSTKDNAVNSYLTRTLDYGQCTQESVGCRAYSTTKAGDNWVGGAAEIYFNDQIKNYSCPAQAEGCSAFFEQLTSSTKSTDLTYLKKAPAYLGCYDINTATAQVDWAASEADLTYLDSRPAECAKFAGACVAAEVGCRNYRPTDGTPEVTGRIGANACDQQCLGYAAFRQEATDFEPAVFPTYFIPSQAVSCPSQYDGCSEFTNIDAAAAGGESLEYYSKLKYCEKPADDGSNIKTYYTWEGTASQGYVLRTHKLMPMKANDVAVVAKYNQQGLGVDPGQYTVDSPAYASDSFAELQAQNAICNKINYQLGLNDKTSPNKADADCRAFYDDEGIIYYRLLTKTVTVDAACHPLRKTESFLVGDDNLTDAASCNLKHGVFKDGKCQRCYNGGQYKDGACVYWTISQLTESTSCKGPGNQPDLYNGCRAYTGSGANNVKKVLDTVTFEPASAGPNALTEAKQNWSTGTVKPESLQVAQYSLAVNNNVLDYNFATGTLKTGEWYQLDFWAQGTAQNLRVSLFDGTGENLLTYDPILDKQLLLTVGNEWKQYKVGPVQFTGNDTGIVKLKFVRVQIQGGPNPGIYYLDNVSVSRVDEKLHLIKKSWRAKNGGNDVPAVCDSTPGDPFPGEALGCRNFVDLSGASEVAQPATGFEKLCRPGAAGCTALYDTYNTPNETKSIAYNVWCAGGSGACTLKVGEATLGTCTVLPGEEGCYIDSVVLPDGVTLSAAVATKTTVIVPADTPMSTPIYLTDRLNLTCDGYNDRNGADVLGCQKVALETQTVPVPGAKSGYDFSETLVRNDPALYKQTLCRDDLVGCSEFRSGSDLFYARDPKLTGNKLCVYKDNVQSTNGNTVSGWFMDGVGRCSDGSLCRQDNDCGGTNTCADIGAVACYPNNIQAGSSYGIWSQKTENYAGFVGQCPATANGCTELVDPADPSPISPSGTPYYAIFDDAFRNRSAECQGKVSQKEGCVLFDQTEIPNKLFGASATYAASAAQNYTAVPPKTENPNTNIILKVDRDRECSEWLSCKTSMTVRDESNRAKHLCYQYSTCRKLGPSGECLDWVVTGNQAQTRLTENVYVGRSTDWYGFDYTGYSLFNKYPVGAFSYLQFENDPAAYLTYQIPDQVLKADQALRCVDANGKSVLDGTACGDGGGRCIRGLCVHKIDGRFDDGIKSADAIKSKLDAGICKSAPEKDSPFSMRMALDVISKPLYEAGNINSGKYRYGFVNKNVNYDAANVCQDSITSTSTCACEYTKVEYKDGTTDYWPVEKKSNIPAGICSAGEISIGNKKVSSVGYPCDNNEECGDGGLCNPQAKIGDRYGLRGFCLEYDLSRPLPQGPLNVSTRKETKYGCLTWLPIETSASAFDLYNTSVEAGYYPAKDGDGKGGEMYCLAGTQSRHYTDNSSNKIEIYDKSPFGTESEVQKVYDTYFESNGRPKIIYGTIDQQTGKASPVQNFDCYDVIKGGDDWEWNDYLDYTHLVCQGYAARMYKPLQAWAWKQKWGEHIVVDPNNISPNPMSGNNAIVLRVEGGNNGGEFYAPDGALYSWAGGAAGYAVIFNHVYGAKSPGIFKNAASAQLDFADSERVVYSLAPSPHDWDQVRKEFGTLVHGPRAFTDEDYKHVGIFSQMPASGSESKPGDETHPWLTAFYSPGPKVLPSLNSVASADDYLYRSPYEETLNRADLAKVCFVPLIYTDRKDHDSVNLSLMSHDFCIDFDDEMSYYVADEAGAKDGANSPAGHFLNYFMTKPGFAGMAAVTYRVGSDNQNWKDFKFTNYNSFKSGGGEALTSLMDNPRNTISERYVAVAADNGTTLPIVKTIRDYKSVDPNEKITVTPSLDPFGDGVQTPLDENFWAVGMDFNKDGEFLGYISRWHIATGKVGSGMKVAVVAVLKNQCQQFGRVYNADSGSLNISTNKAKTDMVWEYTQYDGAKVKGIKHDTPVIPFGSTNLVAGDVNDVWKKRQYTYTNKGNYASYAGLPFSCAKNRPDWQSVEFSAPPFCSDIDLLLQDGAKVVTADIANNNETQAIEILKNWFAKIEVENYKGYTGNEYKPEFFKDLANSIDISGTDVKPPHVYSLNPFTCFGKSLGKCTVGDDNNFSVNARNGTLEDYNGDGHPDEDKNNDGHPDPLIAKGSLTAILQFFASADDNHMPIKRIMIDWQDGQPLYNRNGLYKNHKPYCETLEDGDPKKAQVGRCGTSPTEYSQISCSLENAKETVSTDCRALPGTACTLAGGRHFGDAIRACKSQYFEFTNEYNCSSSTANILVSALDGEAQSRVISMGYTPDDKVCVFEPRVQVQDNWGWCTGECVKNDYNQDGSPDSSTKFEGCYDPLRDKNGNPPVGKILQCNKESSVNGTDPWTYYKGKIIVTP